MHLFYASTVLFLSFIWQHALSLSSPASPEMGGLSHGRRNVLPYQLCSANKVADVVRINHGVYRHEMHTFDLAITAATLWENNGYGLELLAFNQQHNDTSCVSDVGGHRCSHAALNDFFPKVDCDFDFGLSVQGISTTSFPSPSDRSTKTAINHFAITCPLSKDTALPNKFTVSISVDGQPTTKLNVCRSSAKAAPIEVVICTCPHFGYNRSDALWTGSPKYASNHSLIDSFLLYHTKLMGAHVRFNDKYEESFDAVSKYFGGGMVTYRSNWALHQLDLHGDARPPSSRRYDFEVMAQTTCLWEFRHKAQWFITIQSVDNYAYPLQDVSLSLHLQHLRSKRGDLTGAHVPMIESFLNPSTANTGANILQRYNKLGKPVSFGDHRHTPLGNPRKVFLVFVHWLVPLPGEPYPLDYKSAYHDLKLQTLHILALTRPERNADGDQVKLLDKRAADLQLEIDSMWDKTF